MSADVRTDAANETPGPARSEGRCWDLHPDDVPVSHVPDSEAVPLDVPPCPVCGSTSARPRFRIERTRFRHVVCESCGLGSMFPKPTRDEIASFYPAHYYGTPEAKFVPFVESVIRLVGRRQVQFLTRSLPTGARVLDVGCGRGVLLSALADRGFATHGVEISAEAAAGADPRARIRIADRLVDADYPDEFFDLVILWHVFEHLSDPEETLREIRRVLVPGGRVVIAVPNFSSAQARWAGPHWFHLDPPRHLFHYPVEGLQRMLVDHGFDCESAHHFSLRQNPFGWVQSALNAIPGSPRNGLYALLHRRTERVPFHWTTRLWMKLAYWIGMPVAGVLSLFAAALGRGASVHVVAHRTEDAPTAKPASETNRVVVESEQASVH